MNPEIIMQVVCKELAITQIEMQSRKRTRILTDARSIFIQICIEMLPKITDRQIAMLIRRDRTTVIHGRQMFSDLYKHDEGFKFKYEKVINSLKTNPICPPTNKQTLKSESSKSTLPLTSDGLKCMAEGQIKSLGRSGPKNLKMPGTNMQMR